MTTVITCTVEYNRTPGTILKVIRQGVAKVLGKLGERWHKKTRPKHFTRRAYTEYGYQRRTASHTKRKRKRYGHTLPLVWTGQLRRQTGAATISTTRKSVKVKMNAPRYLYQNRKDTTVKPINKADELVRLSGAEINQIGKALHDGLVREMNRPGTKRTRTFR